MNWLADHWLDILGWGGSALLVTSLMQARVLRFRVLNLIACVILVGFNALIGVWPMFAMNAVLSGINVYFIVKLLRERHDDTTFEVLEVGPADEYLRHVLRVHGTDILKYQPDFVWDPTAPSQSAFLVQRGDETVGVVLISDEGESGEIAQVRLDYVTPRFRDFAPGEFVWRHSSLLREHGYRRVISPARMVNPYYDRLGFRREGDSWVLAL